MPKFNSQCRISSATTGWLAQVCNSRAMLFFNKVQIFLKAPVSSLVALKRLFVKKNE
jgi:hypothetical protein